jgi:hypothetical protein
MLSFYWKLALRRTKTTGAEASALSQWLLLLGQQKRWPRRFWPLFLASSYFLLFSFPPSLFCFFFSFFFLFTVTNRNSSVLCVFLFCLWLFFSALFSLFSLLFLGH